jgi:phosphatidate cytidylyltransferase
LANTSDESAASADWWHVLASTVADDGPAESISQLRLRGELGWRIVSAALLIPLALGVTFLGGWVFALFWTAAALCTLSEWVALVAPRDRNALIAGIVSLLITLLLVQARHAASAAFVLAIAAAGIGLRDRSATRIWLASGLFYAAAMAGPAIVLRSDEHGGFLAIIFLFAIVWSTDIAAYFTGRMLGGPKLIPQVSPSKTWTGALGGLLAAMLAAVVIAKAAALPAMFALAMIAVLLSVCAQGGDLFESWVKRKFGAKDSGRLIPGHGGVMDRLDGFMAAALVAMFIGVLRGGMQAPGLGLLMW